MRNHVLMKASLFAIVALAAAPAAAQEGSAAAQPSPPVAATPRDPNAIHGIIQVCEAARGEHRVQLEGGRRYAIGATSEAFDTYIKLLRPGSEEAVAEDDDSGGGTNARLYFTPPQSGEYVVRVSSFQPGGTGDYDLSVAPAAPLPALVSRASRTERSQWQVFDGSLADNDAVEGGKKYDDYELTLTAGQTAMLQVQADNVDTLIQVFRADSRGGTPLAQDDDSGGGTNPFVLFAPTEAGSYVVRVTGYAEDTRGAYRLRVAK